MPLVNAPLWKSLKISDQDVELAVEKARGSRLETVTQVKKAFFTVLLAKEALNVYQIPDEVRNIDSYAFQEMKNLKSIVLPARLSWLGWDAFRGDSALESIYVRAYNPPSFSESDFGFAGHDGLSVYVPRGCENRYKGASGWSNYASYIKGYVYPDLPQPDYYMSTDYSRDGEVRVLQKAEEGSGIDLVFMGDAFSDRQIANGTYSAVRKKKVDGFLGEEPYTTRVFKP